MTNHPNRKQVRLSLSLAELEALTDVVEFARRQGYHPLTEHARAYPDSAPIRAVVVKIDATWKAVHS